jgi:hypothetical protein
VRWAAAVLTTIVIAGSLVGCVRPQPPPVTPSAKQPGAPDASVPADFARLRTEYGDRKDFFDICERDRPLNRLAELHDQQRWDEILAASEAWLRQCPVDIDAHLVTAIALKELGSPLESQHHVRWFRGLVDSILASGDGRTPQTAFVVISVPEEYSVLRVLRMRPTGQALQSGIDVLSVVNDKGAVGVIYFNPAAHFRRLKQQLGAPR